MAKAKLSLVFTLDCVCSNLYALHAFVLSTAPFSMLSFFVQDLKGLLMCLVLPQVDGDDIVGLIRQQPMQQLPNSACNPNNMPLKADES